MPSGYDALRDAQGEYNDASRELEKVNKTLERARDKRDELELRVARAGRLVSFIESTLPQQMALPWEGKGLSLVPQHEHPWGPWEDDAEEHLRTRHCPCGKRQHECLHEPCEALIQTWETEQGVARRITRQCRWCARVEVAVPHAFPPPPATPEDHAEPHSTACTVCFQEPDAEAEFDICRWDVVPDEPVMDEQAKILYYGSPEWNADKRSWEALSDEERANWTTLAEYEAGSRHYLTSPLFAMTQVAWLDLSDEERRTWVAFAVCRAVVEASDNEASQAEQPADEAPPFEAEGQLEMPLAADEAEPADDDQADEDDDEPAEEDAGPAAADESEQAVETEQPVEAAPEVADEKPERRPSRQRRVRDAEAVSA